MKLNEFIQKLLKDCLLIFASIMIIITFMRQIYSPQTDFDLKSIYLILIFSFVSSLIGFILYSPNDISEKKLHLRRIIHFLTLEILLITLAGIIGIVSTTSEGIILALQIAFIYFIVRLLSWRNDKKEAERINEKLRSFNKEI
jgi:Ca2+/Na+ antiporter